MSPRLTKMEKAQMTAQLLVGGVAKWDIEECGTGCISEINGSCLFDPGNREVPRDSWLNGTPPAWCPLREKEFLVRWNPSTPR